jgi:pyruvate dehydrogenase E1 component alpha subunit/2-oxoisovalerate dehydrogenase E1 component alpha subunit
MTAIPEDDPSLGLLQVLRDDGYADPATDPFVDEARLLAMYRHMLRVRLVDERMLARQRQGKIGFYGTITGQEATPIATGFSLEPQDWVFPALREGPVMLVRGFPLSRWLAQVYANEGDLLRGRQMPSHMSSRDVNQVAWSSCIGPQIPQAVGAAMAAKHRGDDTVCVGFMGDGATSQGDFHAAMRFAARFRPPSVLVCQNNHWSISVPSKRQTASATFAVKAHAYGLPGVRVDGNDLLAVYSAVKQAVDRARQGRGPTFIEALTYRMGPHSSSDDPTRYRSEEEVELWRQRDPIDRMQRYLRRMELLDDSAEQALRSEIDEEVRQAIREVESLPPTPRETTLFEDVYEQQPWHLRAQREELEGLPRAPSHG